VNENHTEKSSIFKSILGAILALFWEPKSFPKVSKNQLKIVSIFIPILYRFWPHFGVPKRGKIPEKSRKMHLETPPTHKSRPRLPNDPQSSLKCTPGELQNAQKRAPKAPSGLQIDRFYSRSQSKSVRKSTKIDVTVLLEFLLRLTWFCFRVGSQLEQFWMPTAKSTQTSHGNVTHFVTTSNRNTWPGDPATM